MAGRRCLSAKITESDSFYELTNTAQALYFHLNMQADDDGFINSASNIAVRIKGGAAALDLLVKKRFLLKFGGIYVIKHWRISNSLKNDRLKPLSYAAIAQKIWVKGNKAYTDHPAPMCITLYETRTGAKPDRDWIPNGFQTDSVGIPDGFLTEPNLTEPNLTEPNLTEPNLTEGGVLIELFAQILKRYPQERRGNQAEACKAYRQAVTDAAAGAEMLASLTRWQQSEQWNKDGGRYIPYLVNWILRGTWRERPKQETPKGASGELGEAELEAIQRVLADKSLDGGGDDPWQAPGEAGT